MCVLLFLAFNLDLAISFTRLGLQLVLLLHLFALGVAFSLSFLSFALALLKKHVFALSEALVSIGVIVLVTLLLEQLLNQHVFLLLFIKAPLCLLLVNSELSSSTLTFLTSEIALLLGLLDFIHRGGEGEVLNLSGWDALLLFLLLDSVLHIHIGVDTQLLEVLFKLAETASHLEGGIVKLPRKLSLVEVDLTILKVLLLRNVFRTDLPVVFPVLSAFFLPFLHEVLVFTELAPVVRSIVLL